MWLCPCALREFKKLEEHKHHACAKSCAERAIVLLRCLDSILGEGYGLGEVCQMVSVGSVTQCHYKEELGQSTVINLALRFLLDLN